MQARQHAAHVDVTISPSTTGHRHNQMDLRTLFSLIRSKNLLLAVCRASRGADLLTGSSRPCLLLLGQKPVVSLTKFSAHCPCTSVGCAGGRGWLFQSWLARLRAEPIRLFASPILARYGYISPSHA